jgi:hypothetical protein
MMCEAIKAVLLRCCCGVVWDATGKSCELAKWGVTTTRVKVKVNVRLKKIATRR